MIPAGCPLVILEERGFVVCDKDEIEEGMQIG